MKPTEARHQPIYQMLQERDVLGRVRTILSPFRLRRELSIEIKACDGDDDTYYGNGTVTLCYEYIELLQRHAPKVATPGGVVRSDAIFGAIIDTLLHEAAHGIFDILEIPVLGREEDAADFFSAYTVLQFSPEDARRLFEGVAFMFASEARAAFDKPFGVGAYAGEHRLAPQRYFDYLCVAYGSAPQTFAKAVGDGGLPPWRHDSCIEEFTLLKRSFDKLIGPHVDGVMLEKMRAEARFQWRPLLSAADGLDAQPLGDWMKRSQAGDGQVRGRLDANRRWPPAASAAAPVDERSTWRHSCPGGGAEAGFCGVRGNDSLAISSPSCDSRNYDSAGRADSPRNALLGGAADCRGRRNSATR